MNYTRPDVFLGMGRSAYRAGLGKALATPAWGALSDTLIPALSEIHNHKVSVYLSDMARPKIMESRKLVSLTAETAKAIDDYRYANRIPTESEAIRRLIELGLKAVTNPKDQT